jgi:2-oxoglutarate dehydrogenase E2 component (dihydrolipoamide succinyltransferase)
LVNNQLPSSTNAEIPMAHKVVVPQLGESVIEATVGHWHKQEGDSVTAGEVLVELETDKVDVEVGADQSGILVKIERQEGEDVAVGDVLALIEENGNGVEASRPAAERPSPPAAEAAPLPEAEPVEGSPAPETEAREHDRITPVARRLAEQEDVDLAQVRGSGAGGRITRQDVEGYLARRPPEEATAPARAEAEPQAEPQPAPQRAPQPAPQPAPRQAAPAPAPAGQPEREERVRLSRRRRTIAQRLVEAQQTAALLTTFNEIDMSAVMDIRRRRRDSFREQHGVNLGFSSFFVTATIGALKTFPQLNAEIQGDEVVLKHYYDIGIAVGAEEGLVVPVIRDADRKSFAEIEHAVKNLAQKAAAGNLTLDDLRGGTFTITNGGVFGSLLSTPILNPPQVGILGLHKIEERPIAHNGEVAIRPMMYVALTYDHRIVDGREAVQFLVKVKELVEEPEMLLLEG